jgi:hypothetical protein
VNCWDSYRKARTISRVSLVIGDGNLHVMNRANNRKYGLMTIDHGVDQSDYQAWKANLIGFALNRQVKVRSGHKGKSVQVQVCHKRFKAWYKFIYRNGKKDLTRILPFINNPEFAISVWLMDDGYVERSKSKLKSGEMKNYSAALRIFSCETPEEHQPILIKWLKDNLDIEAKVRFQRKTKANIRYPFLKIGTKDTLKLWHRIRDFVLQFKSMQHKFRHLEQIYQLRMAQRNLGDKQFPEGTKTKVIFKEVLYRNKPKVVIEEVEDTE